MIPLKTKNNLYRTKSFWVSNKWIQDKPIFTFWKSIFRGHYNINKSKNTFLLLLPTLPAFIQTILYSCFVIAVFESYNYFFPTTFEFDTQAVDTLLTAIASISGVFLGLYFTAISSIASNFLIRATQDVRRFFLNAPVGQQYVQTVALTGIISIFYITTKSFGHTIHPAGLIFLSLLSAYIVIRFWSVGSNVFNSLEPTDSLPWVSKDIKESIRAVVPSGFRWKKPYIQKHHQELATYYIGVIENLISFGLKEIRLSDEQLLTALNHTGHLLYSYSKDKAKIPTNSLWYKKKSQFQSWNLADSTEIALALQTGTTIQPKMAQDFTWFEEKVLDISVKILKFFADEKKIGSIFQGNEVFVQVAEFYGKDFDEQALKLLFKKIDAINNHVYSIKVGNVEQPIYKEQLAFLDSQGRMAIGALLGLMKYLDKCTPNYVIQKLETIKWNPSSKSIYLSELPLATLSRIESTATEIQNEIKIEGKVMSPKWYIHTLYIQKYLFSLQSYFSYLKSLHNDYFKPKVEKLIKEGQITLAVHLIQRWIEYTSKYDRLVSSLKKHTNECERFHKVKDLPRAVFNFDQEEKEVEQRQKEVKDMMIQLLPKLSVLVTSDDIPDYFGQALTIGLEECYDACEKNDVSRLKSILPAVFSSSLTAFDKIRVKVQNWSQEESKLIYSTEPLENLFEISGYAKLYAELYQNPELWNPVKTLWDTYLSQINAKQAIQFIASISAYRDAQFTIMPQANLRMSWKMSFENKLRENGFSIFPDRDSYDHINGRRQSNHPSPLIRVVANRGGLIIMTNVRDVFFATYLSNHPEATGIEFPDRRDLKEHIEREQNTPQQNEE